MKKIGPKRERVRPKFVCVDPPLYNYGITRLCTIPESNNPFLTLIFKKQCFTPRKCNKIPPSHEEHLSKLFKELKNGRGCLLTPPGVIGYVSPAPRRPSSVTCNMINHVYQWTLLPPALITSYLICINDIIPSLSDSSHCFISYFLRVIYGKNDNHT